LEKDTLTRQLEAYGRWRVDLIRTVREYAPWLQEHGMATPESERRIAHCLETLENDRLTIAVVAELSRGKTELINAIFFSDYGCRLLPSAAGRTTMCPTEIFYDSKADSAYVRLLPIETRLQESALSEIKKDLNQWVHLPLNLDATEQMQEALAQVVQTKRVTMEEAAKLGLYKEELDLGQNTSTTHVEIPKWRHALISFPHPLLKQGLSILDTPGLNALGYEPELTLNMLPDAQAVLFVLAADAGVTRTDLEMWQHHIKGFRRSRQRGLVVVLNKIDVLWDELQKQSNIQDSIQRQRSSTAKVLGIGEEAVFPVSAQKGLLAKIRSEESLLKSSALPDLENYLAKDILFAKQEIVQETLSTDICHMLENTRGVVASSLAEIKKQQDELKELSGKSNEMALHLLQKTREEQLQYQQDVKAFKEIRSRIQGHAKILHQALDIKALDQMIAEARTSMIDSWTTQGVQADMQDLFERMRANMQLVVEQSEQSRKLIRAIYKRFQREHGFAAIQPKMFSIMKYRIELKQLQKEVERFRKSPTLLITTKRNLIRRFFSALIHRARSIFVRARLEAETSLDTALQPLLYQIRDHKDMMERRLQELQKISRSRGTLKARIADLEQEYQQREQQLITLSGMYNTLANSQPITTEEHPRPRLVSSNNSTT
jgi:hypothetical protein